MNYSKEEWINFKDFPRLGRKIKILAFEPNKGGCAQYRLIMPFKKLEELYPNVLEIKWETNPLGWEQKPEGLQETIKTDLFEWADIIVTNNIANYGGTYTARVCGIAKQFNKLFWFDTDDLLTNLYEGHRLEGVYKEGLSDTTKFIYSHSDIVTVTQHKFAHRIMPYIGNGILAVIKNLIDYNLPCWKANKMVIPKNKFTRVGWAGGIHHEQDVKEFAGIPHMVNQRVGKEKVRWDFYGKPPPDPNNKDDDWQQDVWKNYERIIMQGFKGGRNYTINWALPADQYGIMYANMDVAIAPLQMNEFNDSKSDIKVAEAGRYSVPLIASNVGCYAETIKNGETGYLIEPDAPATEWIRVLTKVIRERDHREYMGKNLHDLTEKLFNMNDHIHGRLNVLGACLNKRGLLKNE